MIIIKKYIGNFISMQHLYLRNLENKFLTQIVDLEYLRNFEKLTSIPIYRYSYHFVLSYINFI